MNLNRKMIEKNLKDMNLSRSYMEKNFTVTPITTTTTTTNTTKFMKINTNTFHEHIYANLNGNKALKALMHSSNSTVQPIQQQQQLHMISSLNSASNSNNSLSNSSSSNALSIHSNNNNTNNNNATSTSLVRVNHQQQNYLNNPHHQQQQQLAISNDNLTNNNNEMHLNAYHKISNFDSVRSERLVSPITIPMPLIETEHTCVNTHLENSRIRRIFSNLKKLQFNYDNLSNKSDSFNNLNENYFDFLAARTNRISEQLKIKSTQSFNKQPNFDYICYAAAATAAAAAAATSTANHGTLSTTATSESMQSATEHDCERNEMDETIESDLAEAAQNMKLEEAFDKINRNESKFDAQLAKIEEKLKEIHANFERRANKTMEKLEGYDMKIADFQNDFYNQLDKVEEVIEYKIDDRMKEMNSNFEKRFEEFAEKLNSTLQVYLNSLTATNC